MKLVAVLCVLMIFNTSNSMPAEDESIDTPQGGEEVLEGTEAAIEEPSEVEISIEDTMESNITIDEDRTKPSASFLEEVKNYFQQEKLKASHNRVARQSTEGLYQGDTIALQTFVRDHWLGCPGTYCGRARCPLMSMTGGDWSNCWGEVFRIYRAIGPGAVRVGDIVGIYYPHQGYWLGCAPYNRCVKSTCPGSPTTKYGFASSEKWYQCWGEVFRIYAKEKVDGATINSNDDIVLYYLQEEIWVAQGYGLETIKLPCLGKSRPPSEKFFDHCSHETFKVWKK